MLGMFQAILQRRFAKRVAGEVLNAYQAVRSRQPELADQALYRAVLLHTKRVDAAGVDALLEQATDSVDEWTSPGRARLGLREVAHYLAVSQYQADGHAGTTVSFRKIIDAMVPAEL
jgi:hypothetical protein